MPTIPTPHYKVHVDGQLSQINSLIKKHGSSSVFILVDQNTKEHCLPALDAAIEKPYHLLEVVAGEKNKSLDSCNYLWNQLVEHKADRHSLIINLGGGVIGDMGGFVAGTYMRGIAFIQMPTTLLAQADASIGGKLGVDHKGLKNMLGIFRNPYAVITHTPFLETLDEQELKSGYAEVIKHALINSKSAWERIKSQGTQFSNDNWSKLVTNAVKTKVQIVEQDPTEQGLRKILNFGHTVGHAVESFYLGTPDHLLHGEAVAKGMITEAYISFKLGRINIIELEEINSLLESLYTLPQVQEKDIPTLLDLMRSDKKNKDGQIKFALLNQIGACDFDIDVDEALIKESLLF